MGSQSSCLCKQSAVLDDQAAKVETGNKNGNTNSTQNATTQTQPSVEIEGADDTVVHGEISVGQEGNSVEQTKRQEYKEKILKGLDTGLRVVDALVKFVKPALPSPGDKAADALIALLELADQAIVNVTNLSKLNERAADLLKLLACTSLPDTKYRNIIDRLQVLLKNIREFYKHYVSTWWLVRVLHTKGDAEMFTTSSQELSILVGDAQLAEAVMINDTVQKMYEDICRRELQHTDTWSAIESEVKAAGGETALLKDPALLQAVSAKFTIAEQVILRQTSEAVKLLEENRKEGVHSLILQPDVSLLWRMCFSSNLEVEWSLWWMAFPSAMHPYNQLLLDIVQKQVDLEAQKLQFQQRMNASMRNPDCISVEKLRRRVPAEADLLSLVLDLTEPLVARCMLPNHDQHRNSDENELTGILGLPSDPPPVVCLQGQPGEGRTSLVLAAGWKLWDSGKVAGGAVLVSLEGTNEVENIMLKIARQMGVDWNGCDASDRVMMTLNMLQDKGPFLLILDDVDKPMTAEDVVETGFQAVKDTILELRKVTRNLHVLTTSAANPPPWVVAEWKVVSKNDVLPVPTKVTANVHTMRLMQPMPTFAFPKKSSFLRLALFGGSFSEEDAAAVLDTEDYTSELWGKLKTESIAGGQRHRLPSRVRETCKSDLEELNDAERKEVQKPFMVYILGIFLRASLFYARSASVGLECAMEYVLDFQELLRFVAAELRSFGAALNKEDFDNILKFEDMKVVVSSPLSRVLGLNKLPSFDEVLKAVSYLDSLVKQN